jgi:hypothetical protein
MHVDLVTEGQLRDIVAEGFNLGVRVASLTVLRRSFGLIGMSSTDRRCRHFRTVFSLIP